MLLESSPLGRLAHLEGRIDDRIAPLTNGPGIAVPGGFDRRRQDASQRLPAGAAP
jgi:hypothetical protein